MIIAVIVDSLNLSGGGGVGTCVNDLCMGFRSAQTISTVYLIGVVGTKSDDSLVEELRRNGVKICCLGARSRKDAILNSPKYVKKLRNLIKKLSKDDFTVCNLHLKLAVLIGTVATVGLSNIKRVETYHNTYHHYWLQCTMLRPFIAKYICVSSTAKEEMRTRFHIPERKLVAIPNGVNREELRGKIEQYEKEQSPLPVILTVGRLSYEKNIITVAKAVTAMKENGFTYIIIGDGPQRDDLLDAIKMAGNIEYKGALSRDDVLRYLNSSDLVIIPSLWEGRSIFMLEAAAFDKPFILSDCPGLREPFDEPKLGESENMRVCRFGYLVKTNDMHAYQMAIQHFIENPDIHVEMASHVRKVSKENDIENVVKRYIEAMN